MNDGDQRDMDEEAASEAAAESAVEKWISATSDSFEDAASHHASWARAVAANDSLADRLSSLANVDRAAVNPAFEKNLEALAELAPHVNRSLESVHDKLNESVVNALSAEGRAALDSSLRGLAELEPRYTQVLRSFAATQSQFLDSLMPDLRRIQKSLNALNQPAATRETQQFITATDGLRFRGRQRVWHYTSAQALDQILKRHVLWASSPHHLNDASELNHGIEIVRGAIEHAASEPGGPEGVTLAALREVTDESFVAAAMHEIYYLSASTADDSLTLWRNYSSADGFAIGIKPAHALSAEGRIFKDSEADPENGLPAVANWYRVHYAPAKKTELATSFMLSAIKDIEAGGQEDRALVVTELRKHLLILASTLKHEAFKDEHEVRWITTNWAPVDVVHYEVTGRGFVPVLHARSTGFSQEDPYLPISGLRCSPTTSPTIERTMRGLLTQRGYSAAADDVRKSVLPFRG